MSSLFGSGDYDDGGSLPKGGDPELQDFLLREKQRAQFNAQIHELNDVCWDRCVEKPSNKLDSRTETCLQNCVDRFIDVSLHITNRYTQLLTKNYQLIEISLADYFVKVIGHPIYACLHSECIQPGPPIVGSFCHVYEIIMIKRN